MARGQRRGGRRTGAACIDCALVGRDRLFLDVLGGMLRLRRGIRIVATSCDGAAPGPTPPDQPCELVIVHVDGLGRSWERAARKALASGRDVRLILLTASAAAFAVPRRLARVEHAVVGSDGGFPAVLEALERLFRDRLEPLAPADLPPRRHAALTARESEIVALLGEGLTTKEIATRLGRSPLTIQTHRKRIVDKLGRLGSHAAVRAMALRRSHFADR